MPPTQELIQTLSFSPSFSLGLVISPNFGKPFQRFTIRTQNSTHGRTKTTSKITSLTPQFLVDDLAAALDYYRDCLGFEIDFVYESFYASVSRDGLSIHLKCAPKTVADRLYRKENEHLDVYLGVQDIESLFNELQTKHARIIRPLMDQPWGCKDFYVEDVDGYILCFSEQML